MQHTIREPQRIAMQNCHTYALETCRATAQYNNQANCILKLFTTAAVACAVVYIASKPLKIFKIYKNYLIPLTKVSMLSIFIQHAISLCNILLLTYYVLLYL